MWWWLENRFGFAACAIVGSDWRRLWAFATASERAGHALGGSHQPGGGDGGGRRDDFMGGPSRFAVATRIGWPAVGRGGGVLFGAKAAATRSVTSPAAAVLAADACFVRADSLFQGQRARDGIQSF